MTNDNNLYTVLEACKKLQVSRQTLYNWMQRGDIRYTTLPSGRRRIPAQEINKYCE